MKPKAARRGFGAPKEPLKVFDESPVTGQKIQLLEGRYGLYLNDGTTNASLPKGMAPDTLTKEEALDLLATRAAMGPSKKKASRRKSAPAKAVEKKPAAPKNGKPAKPVKKAVKKRTSTKKKVAVPEE